MTTTTAAMEGRNPLSIFVDSILGTDKNYSMKRNLKYALNFKMKARSQEDLIRLYGNPHVDYIMQLETSVADQLLRGCYQHRSGKRRYYEYPE